ncbi:MAG TPA: MobV family relaxase [Tissierellaceae bacterium]
MAHLMKANRNQVGGLTRHFERYKKENGEYIKFQNQEIDTEKTRLNYNLAEDKNQLEFIKERTSEVRCLNRKDVNVMCDWVVTLPEKIKTEEDQEKFFKETYNFLENEYGKENVISSFVHLDETTPHMHFAFIPVVTDKKRGDLKVSAKELITRKHLQEFHPKLENHMEKVFGRDVGILNDATKAGNKSVSELKGETIRVELESLKRDLKASKMELAMIDLAKDEIMKLDQIEAKEKLFNKGYVEIKKDTFVQFKNMAKNYKKDTVAIKNTNAKLHKKINSLEKEIDRLIDEKENNIRKIDLKELKEKAATRNEIINLEKKVEKLSDFIIDQGLAEKFNKSLEKEIEKSRDNKMDFSR